MKVLVIGGGGREHAIVWKLNQSPQVSKIYCAPGNPGIAEIAECIKINEAEIQKLVEFSREISIDLVVVGPEKPLVAGIVDSFRKEGIRVIGPTQKGAQLEGSKSFSKKFMEKYKIPTAVYREINIYAEGIEALKDYSLPVVLKADGLAAGKGVLICETMEEAEKGLKDILVDRVFEDAGNKAVIEEFLVGIETSILCFVDGETIIPMVGSQDHKRIFDGDMGPNTGGMGTYSPNLVYTKQIAAEVEEKILKPTLKGIQEEDMDYRGILFIGLMITEDGPKVLEYNVRFGDPETQVVLTRLNTDLYEIFNSIERKSLKSIDISWSNEAAVCVILASGGYPGSYRKGIEISGLDKIETDIMLFHAGTKKEKGITYTNDGRVLGVTATAITIEEARKKVYENVAKISFDGMQYRRDIAIK
ncbi:phosphoribosylamine--glycine ligase [Alkaliphilus pronyensis]|uniref:Phosphoribosylamine--glycine ligase n=1 Tax=Alkaliphilus pronyensis TaxID=1482732 RepID=A0A6I0EYC3_9FIRM|nr:phosphoribosylamine--glycine ligase [Alkaliphilus pronyensis]KAB3534440.1 phosphoribosylamine--glycine ligase [Alkaliphilus pronyensis]